MTRLLLLAVVLALAASCGDSSSTDDLGTGSDSGSSFTPLVPCSATTDYTTGATAITAGVGGNVFAPKCLRVSVGTTVTMPGSSLHPLMRSTRGSAGTSPIPGGPSTSDQSVTFSTAGFYPYYCGNHGADSGSGMSGVVWAQ